MKNKLALVIALVLGVVAVYGVWKFLEKTKGKYQEVYRPVRVAAAKHRLKAGTVMEMKLMLDAGKEVVENSLTGDHVHHNDRYRLLGLTVNRDVEQGEPLLASYFTRPVVRLDRTIGLGERAITLSVNPITGVSGNIVPGSHVDILGTFPLTEAGARATGGGASGRTMLLLSNMTVLAVDSRTLEPQYAGTSGARRSTYSSVTLAVSPDEANILVHAQSIGNLTLALRTPADAAELTRPPEGVDASNLFRRAAAAERSRQERLKARSPRRGTN